ncbi:asparagine-linked glycosylation protein [Rhodosporidiobolus nylandii]
MLDPQLPWALVRTALSTFLLLSLSLLLLAVVAISLLRLHLRRTRPTQHARLLRSLGLRSSTPRPRIVGFFHPYCNAGGGGERVLWTALACMQREEPDAVYVVYTGDVGSGKGKVGKEAILARVASRFSLSLSPSNLHFVPLRRRSLVEDSRWPRFTMLGQSVGSAVLAYEGISGEEGVVPDVWIGKERSLKRIRARADTMGYAFAYPLIRLLLPSVPIGSYTHYPTISTDMLSRVRNRQAGHTNPSRVARSWVLSTGKLIYYTLFARLYSYSLSHADVIMLNSTWTKRHIDALLGIPSSSATPSAEPLSSPASSSSSATYALPPSKSEPSLRSRASPSSTPPAPAVGQAAPLARAKTRILYPPCPTSSLSSLPLSTSLRTQRGTRINLFSLAQFRPEKEHPTQLRALSRLFALRPSLRSSVRLTCAGSVRNAEDEARVASLKELAKELGVERETEFLVNANWEEVRRRMGEASVGLHTMVDEHFGIGVVEFQAAGLIPLAHASAGPLLDICVPYPQAPSSPSPSCHSPSLPPGPTGFLAPSPPLPSALPPVEMAQSFAERLLEIIDLSEEEQDKVRERARRSAQERFSAEVFERGWRGAWGELDSLPSPLAAEPPALRLPDDVWFAVLERKELDYTDLKRFSRVCKRFQAYEQSATFDSRLFRSPPSDKPLKVGDHVDFHPAFQHINLVCTSTEDAFWMYGDEKKEKDEDGVPHGWLFLKKEFATSPAAKFVYIGMGGEVLAHNDSGVTVFDVVKATAEMWSSELDEDVVGDFVGHYGEDVFDGEEKMTWRDTLLDHCFYEGMDSAAVMGGGWVRLEVCSFGS